MPRPEFSDFPFPEHTEYGYYPLENGQLFVPEELLVFDALCFMRAYLESGLPAPDTIVGIGKGGLADMQRYSYILGTKNNVGKSNVRVLTGQTTKYDENNNPLPEIVVVNAPGELELAPAKIILVSDDMIDKAGSLQKIYTVVKENAPEDAEIYTGTAIAKSRSEIDGIPQIAGHVDVVGRLVGGRWLQLANQFEHPKEWAETIREVKMRYRNIREEVDAYSPEKIIPKFLPHLMAA